MKEISVSIFVGVLLALPLLFILDNDQGHPLGVEIISFTLFLTIGGVQVLSRLIKKEKNNAQS